MTRTTKMYIYKSWQQFVKLVDFLSEALSELHEMTVTRNGGEDEAKWLKNM